jgi:hypothetical protein
VPDQRIQTELDNEFDETAVERLLSNRGANPDDRDKVRRLAAQALSNLETLKPPIKLTKPTEAESWVGSSTSSFEQSAFLARSAELFRGKRAGVAARLNLLGTVDEVQKLLEQQETSLAVLIKEDSHGTLPNDDVVEIKKKASPTKPQPAPQSQEIRPAIPSVVSPPVTAKPKSSSAPQVLLEVWQENKKKLILILLLMVWLAIKSLDPTPPQTPQLQTPTIQR